MKRFLILCLFLFCLALPVCAAEDIWVDVEDYGDELLVSIEGDFSKGDRIVFSVNLFGKLVSSMSFFMQNDEFTLATMKRVGSTPVEDLLPGEYTFIFHFAAMPDKRVVLDIGDPKDVIRDIKAEHDEVQVYAKKVKQLNQKLARTAGIVHKRISDCKTNKDKRNFINKWNNHHLRHLSYIEWLRRDMVELLKERGQLYFMESWMKLFNRFKVSDQLAASYEYKLKYMAGLIPKEDAMLMEANDSSLAKDSAEMLDDVPFFKFVEKQMFDKVETAQEWRERLKNPKKKKPVAKEEEK